MFSPKKHFPLKFNLFSSVNGVQKRRRKTKAGNELNCIFFVDERKKGNNEKEILMRHFSCFSFRKVEKCFFHMS